MLFFLLEMGLLSEIFGPIRERFPILGKNVQVGPSVLNSKYALEVS